MYFILWCVCLSIVFVPHFIVLLFYVTPITAKCEGVIHSCLTLYNCAIYHQVTHQMI